MLSKVGKVKNHGVDKVGQFLFFHSEVAPNEYFSSIKS
jgi:hypothetical protein